MPEAAHDLAIVVPALIEPYVQNFAPVPAREVVPLRSYPTRSASSVGSRGWICKTTMVPHRLYTYVVRECHFLHGQNHGLRRMNDHRSLGGQIWLGGKPRALDDAISRKKKVGASTSEGGRDADEMAQLL